MRITTALGPQFEEEQDTTPPKVTPLQRGAKGEPVRAAQEQLQRAGFTLPRYGADGQYGRETAARCSDFQRAHGLPATGQLDVATLLALENREPFAFARLRALFADGVLHGVLAVGYDEAGSHEPEQAAVLRRASRSAASCT